MDKYTNGYTAELAEYETPFADVPVLKEAPYSREAKDPERIYLPAFESPFSTTFDAAASSGAASPVAGEYVQFLSELHDTEFSTALYELAGEMEDTWSSKISNEAAMGDRYLPYATQQANEYLMPLAVQTESMIDRVAQHFSGNNFADLNEVEIDQFFANLEFNHSQFQPAQEQFFGKIFDKVKNVVKKGVDLAKKGIAAVGKILPINVILNKLKGLVRPLLDKVLRFAIGKLPKNLQPHAQALAKKFLNLEASSTSDNYGTDIPATGELDAVQSEFDNYVANMVFAGEEGQTDQLVMEYESSADNQQRSDGYETQGFNLPPLHVARQQFVDDLRNLRPGESPAPAIERFLPAAIIALQPVIKMAISVIGRDKIIDFLAGLLSQLVAKYIPAEVAKPLASKIIDVGMSAIGFETYETNRSDLAYEAIANTIEETVYNLGPVNETILNDQGMLTAQLLEAFEKAAANNFPGNYIREDLRTSSQPDVWVLKPRSGPRPLYKKYTRVINVTIDPQTAKSINTFRGVPLANFLKDKYGLDVSKPIQARAHLFEAIDGTKLSMIARQEKIPGLGSTQNKAWVQFHPLSKEASSLLLKEPGLGKDVSATFMTKRPRIAIGQRFYFLEIPGARLRLPSIDRSRHRHTEGGAAHHHMPGQSSDIQAVINFVKSEIRLNYFLSEEESLTLVEKVNKNDHLGAAMSIRNAVRNVLNKVLVSNVSNKVRIVHEAMPELYLENYRDGQEHFSPAAMVGKLALNAGKEMIGQLVEKLVSRLSEMAYQSIVEYFKARAAEFKKAQAEPKDGVTVKIIWLNIPGMSGIRAVINAIKGNLSVGNLADLAVPNIPTPEVQISAGKNFD